jgi:hypothetical protein
MFPGILRRLVLTLSTAALGTLMLSGAAFAQTTTASSTTTASNTPATAPVCDWGRRVWGEPESFHAGAADGYYIWCGPSDDGNDREFHLRTTDSKGVFVYSGILRTNGTFRDVEKVRDEADDHVDVLDNGHEIKFSFVTYQGIDGLNFNVSGGNRVSFLLDQSGSKIATSSIYLGKEGQHPKHNPLAIHRLHERVHKVKPASATSTSTATSSTAAAS